MSAVPSNLGGEQRRDGSPEKAERREADRLRAAAPWQRPQWLVHGCRGVFCREASVHKAQEAWVSWAVFFVGQVDTVTAEAAGSPRGLCRGRGLLLPRPCLEPSNC